MLQVVSRLPEAPGSVGCLLVDNGFFSAAKVARCQKHNIEPLLAVGRQTHRPHWAECSSQPPPLPEAADAPARMKHRLKTPQGRATAK